MDLDKDNKIPTDLPCPCGCNNVPVYQWFPRIEGYTGKGMIACIIFFNEVWRGEY